MSRQAHIVIGVNNCFQTRRYEKIESWVDIVKEIGFDYMSLDSDILDPFFSGDMDYVLEVARKLKAYCDKRDLKIVDYFTGMASYRFIGLAHGDWAQREKMMEWFKGAIDIASAIGARATGGRCDAFSVETLRNPQILAERYQVVIQAFQEFSEYAQQKGLESVFFEQMYVPSLKPYTLEETARYIKNTNSKSAGVPVRPVVDVGHACGQSYGLKGDDLLYEKWVERFGAACQVIHVQQTRRDHSSHLPFAASVQGDIRMEAILEALEKSLHNHESEEWSQYLQPPEQIVLMLEAIPSTAQCEEEILEEMRESCEHMRKFVPKEGLYLSY